MCQYSDLLVIIQYNDNTFQSSRSRSINLYQSHRSLLDSDRTKHHKPITSILDLTLHQISITSTPPPWPNDLLLIQVQASSNTMVQKHLELIPWTQYLGSILRIKYHGPIPKYHGPNITNQNFIFRHVCTFPSVNLCVYVYTPFVLLTHVYTHFHQD